MASFYYIKCITTLMTNNASVWPHLEATFYCWGCVRNWSKKGGAVIEQKWKAFQSRRVHKCGMPDLFYQKNKIESQSKTASRLLENKIKTMSRPWLTSHVKTMLSRLCQDYVKTISRPCLSRPCLSRPCLSIPYLTRPCLSRPYLLRPFWQDLVFRYHVMTNLIHSELI